MFFALAVLINAAMYTAQSSAVENPKSLVQLSDHLRTAISRASLTDQQKARLQSDSAVLEAAKEAKEQGRAIDRQQVTGAVRDIRTLAASGAFSPQDQQALRADIEALRKQQ